MYEFAFLSLCENTMIYKDEEMVEQLEKVYNEACDADAFE